MKPKSMLLFLVAAGFGLVAMLGVMQALEAKPEKEPEVDVLVATVKIPPGVSLDESNTAFRTLPISAVPQGAIRDRELTAGKALFSYAAVDDVITEAKISENAFSPSTAIPAGMRAETIRVDAAMSHSGLLRPGDRVDVVCTYRNTQNNRQVTKTKVILEYVEVFASDNRRSTADSEGDAIAKHVTLLVTPEQAVLVNLTRQRGTLSLTLRSKLDDAVVNVAAVTDDILEDGKTEHAEREPKSEPVRVVNVEPTPDAVPEPAEPVIPTWHMTIYSGDSVEDVEVVDDDAMRAMGLDADARRRARTATRRSLSPVAAPVSTSGDDEENGDAKKTPGFRPAGPDATAPTSEADADADAEGDGDWIDAGLDFLESL
ncbi:MAG: Flp pilus assembly protein CpaB [Planctomycetota bacterium]